MKRFGDDADGPSLKLQASNAKVLEKLRPLFRCGRLWASGEMDAGAQELVVWSKQWLSEEGAQLIQQDGGVCAKQATAEDAARDMHWETIPLCKEPKGDADLFYVGGTTPGALLATIGWAYENKKVNADQLKNAASVAILSILQNLADVLPSPLLAQLILAA